jgi:hypothetical protein
MGNVWYRVLVIQKLDDGAKFSINMLIEGNLIPLDGILNSDELLIEVPVTSKNGSLISIHCCHKNC